MILAAVLIPLAAAPLILLLAGRRRAPQALSLAAAALQLAAVVSLLRSGGESSILGFSLRADPLGLLFALVASTLWGVTVVYASGYLGATGDRRPGPFYASLAVCLSATAGIAFAADPLTFVVFYEVLTLATYPLVIHTRKPEAIAAGRKYLAYTLAGGQLLLAASAWAAALAPGESFVPGGFLAGRASPGALIALFSLFAAGLGVKAALMPLHGWLPAAMAAPVPVSALLHAVAVVKAGAFGFLRLAGFVFGPELMGELGVDAALAAAASFTIIAASLRALREANLKRRLAYSTVGQLSYIVLGAAVGTPAALAGAAFHIAAHGLLKITLFFCAGSLYVRARAEDVSRLAGIGRRMPVTMAAFALAALGLAGLPGLAGFVSKWNLGWGAFAAGQGWLAGVLIVSGVINLSYFFPVVHSAFFEGDEKWRFDEPRAELWLAPAATVLGAVALGLAPGFILALAGGGR